MFFQYFCFYNVVVGIQFLSDPVPVNEGGRTYPAFVRIFWGRNFYSRMPFLKPTHITYRSRNWPITCLLQQEGRSTILNLAEHSCSLCNKISSGETLLIRRMFLWSQNFEIAIWM